MDTRCHQTTLLHHKIQQYCNVLFRHIVKKPLLSSVNNRLIPSDIKTMQGYVEIGSKKHITKMTHLFFLLYYFTILCNKYKLTTTLFGMNLIGCYEDKTVLFWEDTIEILIHPDSLAFFTSTERILHVNNYIFEIQKNKLNKNVYFRFYLKNNPQIYIKLLIMQIIKDTISSTTWNDMLRKDNYSLQPFGLFHIQVLKQKFGISLLNQMYKNKWKIKCHPSLYHWIMKLDIRHISFTNTIRFTPTRGTLYEQVFRNIVVSMCVKKHNLLCQYAHQSFTNILGIHLYIGTKLFDKTIVLSDDNYHEILQLNRDSLQSNIDPMQNAFQTKSISTIVYKYITEQRKCIIRQNPYKNRYTRNKNILIHIDDSINNVTYEDYKNIIESIPYEGSIYILTTNKLHFIICKLKESYSLQFINPNNNVRCIQFCSTCEYVILSHSMLSTLIGYLSFYSYVFYFKDRSNKTAHCIQQPFKNQISKWFEIQLKL